MKRLILAAFAACFALPATAQQAPNCGTHDAITGELKDTYGEHRTGVGMVAGGQAIVEVYAADKGSWTLIITGAKGKTCVIFVGDGWIERPEITPTGQPT